MMARGGDLEGGDITVPEMFGTPILDPLLLMKNISFPHFPTPNPFLICRKVWEQQPGILNMDGRLKKGRGGNATKEKGYMRERGREEEVRLLYLW